MRVASNKNNLNHKIFSIKEVPATPEEEFPGAHPLSDNITNADYGSRTERHDDDLMNLVLR